MVTEAAYDDTARNGSYVDQHSKVVAMVVET